MFIAIRMWPGQLWNPRLIPYKTRDSHLKNGHTRSEANVTYHLVHKESLSLGDKAAKA